MGLLRGVLIAVCGALAVVAPFVQAQAYPNKSIKIIVPFPPGGTTDVVAKAAPDGYTLLMHNISFPLASLALGVAGRSPYNIETDFAPVTNVVNVALVFTAPPATKGKDLREFANLLKADSKAQFNYGSTGPGSFMNVMGELLKKEAKIEMAHIPFRGAAPMKVELLAGRIQLGGDQVSSSLAEIKNGSLKALATVASKRIVAVPEVPTVRELGFPNLEVNGWNGVFAPAKTPKEVIDRLQREIAAALKNPELAKRLTDLAADPVGSSPVELEAIVKGQLNQFRPIVTELKPSVD